MAMSDPDLDAFLAMIPWGRANAVKQDQLAAELGTTTRKVQSMVLELLQRSTPVVVCSACEAPHGMYRPMNAGEADQYLANLRSRALSTLRHYSKVKRAVYTQFREVQADLFA